MKKQPGPPAGEELRAELEAVKSKLEAVQSSAVSLEAAIRTTPMSVKVQLQKPDEKGEGPPSLAGVIKDEVILIGSLIFFVGIISTDSYYNRFSITYQFLNLPTFHIIYRGLTMPFESHALFIPYVLAVGWLAFDNSAGRRKWSWFMSLRGVLVYPLILLLIAIAYPLANGAGERQAETDLIEQTSTLPKIALLQVKNKHEPTPDIPLNIPADVSTEEDEGETPAGAQTPPPPAQAGAQGAKKTEKGAEEEKKTENQVYTYKDDYRLLVIDSDFVILFKPMTEEDVLKHKESKVPNIKRIPKGEIDVLETIRVAR